MNNQYEKKYFKLLFLILIITSLIFVLCLFLFPNVHPINSDLLIESANNYGCIFTNGDDEYILNYKYEKYYDTKYNSCPIKISYIEVNNSDQIIDIYQYYVNEVINNDNITGNSTLDINLGTIYKERETSGDYFKSVTLFKNKILFISCPKEYINTAINIKEEFGFYYEPNWEKLILMIVPIILSFIYLCLINLNKFKK